MTNDPKPTPLDPSELSLFKKGYDSAQAEQNDEALEEDAPEGDETVTGEEAAAMEASQESQEETQAAADSAGVEASAGSAGN